MIENEQSKNSESDVNKELELEETSSDSKLIKAYKKKRASIKKVQKVAKQKLLAKLQIVLFLLILVLCVSWNKVENVLYWLAGQEKITVETKTILDDCFKIETIENESYCVDEESYNLAKEYENFLLEEYQYSFKLKVVE